VRRNGRILAEMTPQEEFAGLHGFRMLFVHNVAVNPDPAIDFRVETFERSDNFNPDNMKFEWGSLGSMSTML
jgi:hypothetical protein